MSILEKNKADIIKNVSSKNVKESNLVLRKFYDELSREMKVGWNYQSYRDGQDLFVGRATFGEMWIDYKQKGQINNIYIRSSGDRMKNIVNDALDKAISDYDNRKLYNVRVFIKTIDIFFADMCKNDIEIHSSKENGEIITQVTFTIRAFGRFDLQYIINQKINYLKFLLCAYTNFIFDIEKWQCLDERVEYVENEWENYDLDWIDDFFEVRQNEIVGALPPDFFELFRLILNNDSYEKKLRLLLNSAQEIFCGKLMINDILSEAKYNIPGYVDIANTVLVSALEPLSNIGSKKPEVCPSCGNIMYKIRKRVEDLCRQYVNENLTKDIAKIGYGRRSSFLHEGNARTNEFYCGRCVPLLDPTTQNSFLLPISTIDINMFDYVTYIFRKKVHDLLLNKEKLL